MVVDEHKYMGTLYLMYTYDDEIHSQQHEAFKVDLKAKDLRLLIQNWEYSGAIRYFERRGDITKLEFGLSSSEDLRGIFTE